MGPQPGPGAPAWKPFRGLWGSLSIRMVKDAGLGCMRGSWASLSFPTCPHKDDDDIPSPGSEGRGMQPNRQHRRGGGSGEPLQPQASFL